jgi:MFS superfamily sulfate permease-like transporter
MASGFPPFGGVITAIVGGMIVGPLCGSQLTIKGPAAGLIAIAVAAVEALGRGDTSAGYRYTLAVIVVASIIQMAFALFKFGRFADFFPASVVHGMLAAIGVIIISKQIHPLLGVKPLTREPIPLLLEIPHSLVVMNPEIALVGFTSVLIVIFATSLFGRLARYLPGPLAAVLAGIGFCLYFDFNHAHAYKWYSLDYSVDSRYLVDLPASFLSGITLPDFSKIATLTAFEYIVLFALIGSLESLLTCKAVDALDPWKRKADMNKHLLALGFGNAVCGFLGGLPMIAEVVRSSANIGYGARTRWANAFHGLFLLIFVLALSPLIRLVPSAALAGVLCVVGYRLASPRRFRECKKIGPQHLAVFVITIVATLKTDLLMGVVIGMIAEYFLSFALGAPLKSIFVTVPKGEERSDSVYHIILPTTCTFGNVIGFKRELTKAGQSPIALDFSRTSFIDHTFMHEVREAERDHDIKLTGIEKLEPITHHRSSLRRASKRKFDLLAVLSSTRSPKFSYRRILDRSSHTRDDSMNPSHHSKEDISALLESVAHLLPTQGPIDVFIHHNTLHAFEHLSFEEAVKEAARIYGAETFLPEQRYLDEFRAGRITERDLDQALRAMPIEGPSLGDLSFHEITKRFLMIAPPVERFQEVKWLLRESTDAVIPQGIDARALIEWLTMHGSCVNRRDALHKLNFEAAESLEGILAAIPRTVEATKH